MRILLYIQVAFILSLSNLAYASNDEVVYFLGNNHLVATNKDSMDGFKVNSLNLDGQHNLEKLLVEGIDVKKLSPEEMKIAEIEVNKKLEELDKSIIQKAFMPLLLAAKFDIKKIPAFVFDEGAAVVYGVTNTIEAIQIYETWRNRQ